MKIADLHCDIITYLCKVNESLYKNQAQFDIERATAAGVSIQFMAMFTMPGDPNLCLRQILKQLEKFNQEMEAHAAYAYHLLGSDQLDSIEDSHKLACILHLEGADCIGTDLEILRFLYRCGLRSMGLTWNHRNLLADGGGEGQQAGGLSRKGREVVLEMDRLGMMLDLSHISYPSFFEAMELYTKPVLVTHANARSLCPHWRNLDDHQLRLLGEHEGIIGINQVSDFVKEEGAGIDDFLEHIIYIANLIGVEHVALGSDFDGADKMVIGDVKGYVELPELLRGKGFTAPEIEKILYTNALQVIKKII